MLQTPIGQFSVFFDEVPLKNEWQKLPDYRHHIVDGRYCIVFKYKYDNCQHSLKCCLLESDDELDIGIDSGEELEALDFCFGDFILTLGAKGDAIFEKSIFDYGVTYLVKGIQYDILSDTKSQNFVFCIAWVIKKDKEDVRTWFAADPNFIKFDE